MRALALLALALLGADGGTEHVHCWHESPLQHAAPFHRDEHCCRCSAAHCVHLMPPDKCDGSHGPRCRYPELDLMRPLE